MSRPTMRLAATREGWHRVAEHVLAAAQYADTGEISLRPFPGGFQTVHSLRGGRHLSIVNTQLVVTDNAGVHTTALTTIGEVARFVGITPGMPDSAYPPATPLEPDAPLNLDPQSALVLADWYELADTALDRLVSDLDVPAQTPILWPEHFDIGITIGSVNYGASPGDEHIDEPYLYVGPHGGPPARDDFWNAVFGAATTIDKIASTDDAVAFFRAGYEKTR